MFRISGKVLALTAAAVASCTAACSAVTAAGASGATISGAEHFQVLITSTDSLNPGGQSSLVATGAIGSGGVAVTNSYGNSWNATFKVHRGSFKVTQSVGNGTESTDQATCILTQRWHGTYRLSHGTGAYTHISGHGTYTLYWLVAMPKAANGNCMRIDKPIAFQMIYRFSGPVRF